MANPFSKGWKYLTASLDQKIEENADPLVQIQQASEAAKRQHLQVREQATQVIGNRNQLELKLGRLVEQRDQLEQKTRQALSLADGEQDSVRGAELQRAAEIYATQLVGVEQEIESAKTLHAQAAAAAEDAERQLQQSEARLQDQLAQIDQLRSQVQQTKMQEASVAAMDQITGVDPDGDVPSLDQVREKIERRYANALGAQELTEHSMQDRMAEIESSASDMRAQARLEQIRSELSAPDTAAGEIER